ncbi:SDR family oxidoreductase (plasmid) [Agrobacterium tumefaciens]|uniref:SDR family NAD(P)-dependent oxidoreductase n=1 Tax=Rhizobium/Agrobacterium group TaxID=227290 RepID=UPI001574A9AA|nr:MULTISPECIES: SDR family NAD(P)-dependent oxidoreductase [Rhizobium/Agrobacterium group]NTI66020.1 SDR family oxidoreductase [Rhizobium rhizogenes]UXS56363.1 SDR family oxidoreductase [Agrobacterium tumefaciens]UXS66621.1 SDR family oxidoreductase [Agrobacterium tumefaciens]UXS74283.1 SDR family oxidoreductase [Agrobacterium tumefaciens]UXS81947.1 SDR family oxidoreductase [Agrobacterium tumefaciens]
MELRSVLQKFRLDGKVALITGGTRGIGLAAAHAFGEAGAKLYLSARREEYEDGGKIQSSGYAVTFIPADLTTRDAATELVNKVIEDAGKIDILVNNAGLANGGDTPLFTEEQWRDVMALNVHSVFWCSQAVINSMRDTGGGTIVNVGSMSGIVSNIPQNQVAYNSSKAAVHMMTKSLASELAEDNIRVNAVAPGYIETIMSRAGMEHPVRGPIWREMTPMKRFGKAEEVAAAILFLASEASSYVTGDILVVDGGHTTR